MKIQHGQKKPQKRIFFLKHNFFPAFVEKYVADIFFLFFKYLAASGLHCCTGFSLVAASRGYSSVAVLGLVIAVASLLQSTGSRAHGLQWLRFSGSRAQAQCSWHMGLIAPRYGGLSQIRDRTHVSCTGRHILYHWATREPQHMLFKNAKRTRGYIEKSPSHSQPQLPLPRCSLTLLSEILYVYLASTLR